MSAIVDKQYSNVNLIFGQSNADFMNHGYYPSAEFIDESDYLFKNQITLYLQMFNCVNYTNKSLLEIGCGRGGGIDAIYKYLGINNLCACDMNELNIKYCKKNQNKNINFEQSFAQSLRYPDKTFDIVLSVESSHCYENSHLFFKEVNRVLKDDGVFLYTDCGMVIHSFNNFFSFFKKIIREDITENVKKSCEEDYYRFDKLIENKDIKKIYMDIAKFKADQYGKSNNQYIKYIAFK